jgi:hypothetical protein
MKTKLGFTLVATFFGMSALAQPLAEKKFRSSTEQLRTATVPPPMLPALALPDVQVVRAVAVTVESAPVPSSEGKFNTESAKMFSTKVQPILMNRCAECHSRKDHPSEYKLKWIEPGLNDPQNSDANLRASAKWLTPTHPHDSPLLRHAITAHGQAKEPPLTVSHVAYKPLELWVHWACGPDGSAAPTSIPPKPNPAAIPALQPVVATRPPEPLPAPNTGFAATLPKPPSNSDPFDPAGFNRIAHPNRK